MQCLCLTKCFSKTKMQHTCLPENSALRLTRVVGVLARFHRLEENNTNKIGKHDDKDLCVADSGSMLLLDDPLIRDRRNG